MKHSKEQKPGLQEQRKCKLQQKLDHQQQPDNIQTLLSMRPRFCTFLMPATQMVSQVFKMKATLARREHREPNRASHSWKDLATAVKII